MIQLYKKGNTNYKANGDHVLHPIECQLEADLSGNWKLTLTAPLDDEGSYRDIVSDAVLKIQTWQDDDQLYVIRNVTATDTEVTAYARPIFLDAEEIFLIDVRPTECKGQEALDRIFAGQTKYSGKTDISKISTAYYQTKTVVEALLSSDENSFLNRWGGEVLYDNYTIKIAERLGVDAGARCSAGYNCTAVKADIDMSDLCTRIIPKAYNGLMLSGDEPWIDSPLIGRYRTVHPKVMSFDNIKLASDATDDDMDNPDVTVCASQFELWMELKKACREQFEAGIDLPKCSYTFDMIDPSLIEDYSDIKDLETIHLGDTVRCYNKDLDINTSARVIKWTYDCILQRPIKIELGDYQPNYFAEASSILERVDHVVDKAGRVKGGEIAGIINGMQASLKVQQTAAKRQESRAILFEDLDEKSPTYGAMCLGTQGFEIAHERTPDGLDWKWTTFGTAQGFLADCIITGLLCSANYDPEKGTGFGFNLDNGKLTAADCNLSGKLTNKATRTGKHQGSYIKIDDGALLLRTAETAEYTEAQFELSCKLNSSGEQIVTFGNDLVAQEIHETRKSPKTRFFVGSRETKSGRVNFSDGTYLEFMNGFLVGGNTSGGAF
jgi:phage minor structural protein